MANAVAAACGARVTHMPLTAERILEALDGDDEVMKAVAFSEFGGPEVLQVADLPVPEPGAGEVRVRVAAATVNPTDIGMRSGGRAAELAEVSSRRTSRAWSWPGTVDARAAAGSRAWQVGERVLGISVPTRNGRGAQSEYTVVCRRTRWCACPTA